MLRSRTGLIGIAASMLLTFCSVAGAASFADSVVSYSSGSLPPEFQDPPTYQNPATALGQPNPDVNAGQPFGYAALTPFNATYQQTEMVGIGAGGSLTLHLARPAAQIGVHSGVGLVDFDFPNGQNAPSAFTYTDPRQALIEVSQNGLLFVSLGLIDFDSPTNFFDQGVTTPGNQTAPGTHEADFGKPFTGSLSSFDDRDWPGTLAVLDGSAGGEWFDIAGVLPGGASFVRFSVPLGQSDPMFVDAVALVPVPEPAGALLVVLAASALARRGERCIGERPMLRK